MVSASESASWTGFSITASAKHQVSACTANTANTARPAGPLYPVAAGAGTCLADRGGPAAVSLVHAVGRGASVTGGGPTYVPVLTPQVTAVPSATATPTAVPSALPAPATAP